MITRIAMWSGPRNISTAMMRSWGSRPDTVVCDEPFYARYLMTTGIDHPGREEVIARHETNEAAIIANLLGPLPQGKAVYYQKHMAHHLLGGMDRRWLDQVNNCFLIRDPREVLLSYSKVVSSPTLMDLGLPQQWELFERERDRTGLIPPVLDARDVLENPRGTLTALCGKLGLAFDERQLHWPPGRRPTDGIWARYWYSAVEKSTGFESYRPRTGELPEALSNVLAECRPIYEELHRHRLSPAGSDS